MEAPLIVGAARIKTAKNTATVGAAVEGSYDEAQQLYETQYDENYSGIKNTQIIRSEKEAKKKKRRKKHFFDQTSSTSVAQRVMENSPKLSGQIRKRGKAMRLAMRLGWFWAVPFGLQFTGAVIAFVGLVGLTSADAVPLLGDFITDVTNISGLIAQGGLIAAAGGSIGYIVLLFVFLISRVNIFTWPILLSFAVTFGLHVIPVVNFLPLIIIWMIHIMIDPILNLKKSMGE